ncbi:MAG: alkaline phosphatase family protein [Planctomycetes bacterium]|nr:alkaline phosphatase family protein [Planctomycetota bacterium]
MSAILISVDGLRSDAILALPADELPSFTRLRGGTSTLNARCDPDYSITLPNHTSMITGRPVLGPDGHHWIQNDEAPEDATLHKNRGQYVASAFDVVHDRGWHTALLTGKPKFALYDHSYDVEDGAPDTTGPDDGRDKLDDYVYTTKTEEIGDGVLRELGDGSRHCFLFVHFAVTDLTAHVTGWDITPGSKYMKAVQKVDAELGKILAAIDAQPALRGRTAIVLTADHGGGAPFKSHDQHGMWVDYIIPFLVWTGAGPRADLYELNTATRKDPSLANPPTDAAGLPPIRNGEGGNVALQLLGLPAIAGSTLDGKQDLRLH